MPHSEVGKQTFFKSSQITYLHIYGLIPLSQVRKFLRCAGLQIANPQIFKFHKKLIRKCLQNTAKICLKSLKSCLFKGFFLIYKVELEHYMPLL
jgi:hypothetical protein